MLETCEGSSEMLSIKQAAEQAMKYLSDLFREAEDITLEEVESDPSSWLITLSYLADRRSEEQVPRTLAPMYPQKKRNYKIFTVDKVSGEVTSMKIRNVQGV
jgi:hypothetical protein